jgi:hypothetical protein
MKWRYQNQRIVLHRPVLLNLANRGVGGTATRDEAAAVQKCREIAKETIDDISREWVRNQISGWNAVWFLYQAVMIPLVSIFWETNSPAQRDWQCQIELCISLFDDMADWSLAARRSRVVVSKMYEASRKPLTRQGTPGGEMLDEMSLREVDEGMVLLENQAGNIWDLDGMLWSHLPDGLAMPFDTVPVEYGDGYMDGVYPDGGYMMHQ